MTNILLISGAAIWVLVTALWFHQRATRNATLIDVAWALGTAAQTILLAWNAQGDMARRLMIASLALFWALRLAQHLFFDRVLAGAEDGRYARFRRKWSQSMFYALYLVQGALIFALPLSFLSALENQKPFPQFLDGIGLAIWILALAGESAADKQLARFRANPANQGKTCREGLWRYSRHPNYFFEWLLWCAYVPMAAGSPTFFVSLLGPGLLLLLLTKVSGIPPTEEQAISSRGDDYRAYQRETSAFFPWFPKKGAAR